MALCSKCGAEVAATSDFCESCGTGIPVDNANQSKGAAFSNIPVQETSEAWKKTFALLEKAGGPKLPKANELAFRERSKVSFNSLGFVFGPFYYLAKGMWRKAISLFALCIVAIVILAIILDAVGMSDEIPIYLISSVVFATRANIDYYKKIVLGDHGWW
jgi:hypothetical protein